MNDVPARAARALLQLLRAEGADVDLDDLDPDVADYLDRVDRWRVSLIDVEVTEHFRVPVLHAAGDDVETVKSSAVVESIEHPRQWALDRSVASEVAAR